MPIFPHEMEDKSLVLGKIFMQKYYTVFEPDQVTFGLKNPDFKIVEE